MRTMDFDRIATAAPLDRQASVARDGSGDLWQAKVPEWHAHWNAPPLAERPMPPQTPDLSGRKFGRLTVIRYHRAHKHKGAQWLVRCTCGAYELRCTAVIKAEANPDHCCQACDWLKHINWRRNGSNTAETRKADEALLDSFAKTEVGQ